MIVYLPCAVSCVFAISEKICDHTVVYKMSKLSYLKASVNCLTSDVHCFITLIEACAKTSVIVRFFYHATKCLTGLICILIGTFCTSHVSVMSSCSLTQTLPHTVDYTRHIKTKTHNRIKSMQKIHEICLQNKLEKII